MAKMVIGDGNNFSERYVSPVDYGYATRRIHGTDRFVAIWEDINGVEYDRDIFAGSGLTYTNGIPSGGTITSWTDMHAGRALVKITGLDYTGANLGAYQSYSYMLRGDDIINGGNGDDQINGYLGADVIRGNDGNDYIITSSIAFTDDGSNDKAYGGNGNDNLIGHQGDVLVGGAGNDTLQSINGGARLVGGAGDDTYFVTDGTDVCVEKAGGGTDTLVISVSTTLSRNFENLTLNSQAGEHLVGKGNGSANRLYSSSGRDTLYGRGGNDILTGYADDVLVGGAGKDTFLYVSEQDLGDLIKDFSAAQGDRLRFYSSNFGNLANGKLAAGHFVANPNGVAKDANDYFVFSTKNKTLYWDADGNGAGAAVKIARFANGANITNNDILISNVYV